MNTSNDKIKTNQVKATGVRFTLTYVYVTLSDGREVGVSLSHPKLTWLAQAGLKERNAYEITSDGQMVMWWGLGDGGDGLEVAHLLNPQPLATT